MGYYVYTTDVDIFLDKNKFEDVYKKMCELNDYDDLKRGGSYGGNDEVTNERYNKNKWFSWMDYNYPETCKNMEEVLTQVGFQMEFDDEGNLINLMYDYNKTGNEEYFLMCLAGYVKDGSYISFKGEEDDHYYRFIFENNRMYRYDGEIEITYSMSEVYDFGVPTKADQALNDYSKQFREQLKQQQVAN